VYTFTLWIVFALLVTPGYIAYKKRTFSLEGKLNELWSRSLGGDGRTRIQNALGCCGYFSPFVEAAVTQTCYARSTLAGCKNQFLHFERFVLGRWYIVAFALVPLQLGAIVVGLLCSNHVTYRFGKGMTPKAYRLDINSMAVIMDNYAKWVPSLVLVVGRVANNDVTASSRSSTGPTSRPRRWRARARTSSSTRCPRLGTGNRLRRIGLCTLSYSILRSSDCLHPDVYRSFSRVLASFRRHRLVVQERLPM
jgi:hypothetical protein